MFRGRASKEDVETLNSMLNPEVPARDPFVWDGRALASLSRMNIQTSSQGSSNAVPTDVSYDLLRRIAMSSETVNAILRRTVDDVLGNGYKFVLAPGVAKGDESEFATVSNFFRSPNPDDVGDEWLESLIFDLQLYGDAYIELSGSRDEEYEIEAYGAKHTGWSYDGELLAIYPIAAHTMKILPSDSGELEAPPEFAYCQTYNGKKRFFTRDKVLHMAKHKQGRAYGSSPLVPLLDIIASLLNLKNYIGELFTGTIPKTILNVGDISNSEMKAMLALIEQQLVGAKTPFGLIALNGGTGFTMHQLIDSTREGQFLDLLYFYREQICAVFGIPPMKLGWVQTGKLSNPEQQLDAWYDVIDSFHRRVEALINNNILPMMGVTDWAFAFNSIRPSRDRERAEIMQKHAQAVASLRQESAISINEARTMLGLDMLEAIDAEDPFFISPKLSINQQQDDAPAPPEPVEENYPVPPAPKFLEEVPDLTEHASNACTLHRRDTTDALKTSTANRAVAELSAIEYDMAEELSPLFDGIGDNTSDVFRVVDATMRRFRQEMENQMVKTMEAAYRNALAQVNPDIEFNQYDYDIVRYWAVQWVHPSLMRTMRSRRNQLLNAKDEETAMAILSPDGAKYRAGFFSRLCDTESSRVVEHAIVIGYRRIGVKKFRRNAIVDNKTDSELCLPFDGLEYTAEAAANVLPAHPFCRCNFEPIGASVVDEEEL